MKLHARSTIILALLTLGLCPLVLTGCGAEDDGETETAATTDDPAAKHDEVADEDEGHNLHGYWCVAHGIPEEICAQCNSKLAAEYQEKGDWCEEHGRPDSQCFIHHPELAEEFAAQYEAKFGEKPPARLDE